MGSTENKETNALMLSQDTHQQKALMATQHQQLLINGKSARGMRDTPSDIHCVTSYDAAVNCPSDMIDQIGGWAAAGVGQYGEGGYGTSKFDWLDKLFFDYSLRF